MTLVGTIFDRLTVLSETDKIDKNKRYLCQCICGKQVKVKSPQLKNGKTTSCGCKRGVDRKGMSTTSVYATWRAMHRRCTDPKHKSYPQYGGRGIKVCDRWKDFLLFVEDMGPRPPKHTLDRYDNYKDYEPGNCKWSTNSQQAFNRRPRHEPF